MSQVGEGVSSLSRPAPGQPQVRGHVLVITAITILQTQASVFLPWTWISDYLGDTAGQDGVYHTIGFVASEVECMKVIIINITPRLWGRTPR